MKRLAVAMCLFVVGTATSAAPVSDPYSSLLIIGDSLSDTENTALATSGRTPSTPPYYPRRFSNGLVWTDHIAGEFKAEYKPVFNAAFGGARVVPNDDAAPDLLLQLLWQSFNYSEFGDRPLAAIWLGGNDVFSMVESGSPLSDLAEVAETMVWGLDTLRKLSVDDFVLFELPDFGTIPRYLGTTMAERATLFSKTFNQMLRDAALQVAGDGASVDVVPVERLFDTLLSDPGLFGVSVVDVPCVLYAAEVCSDPDDRAFFDPVHPSAMIHAAIADAVRVEMNGPAVVPVPAGLPLLASGVVILIGFRRL